MSIVTAIYKAPVIRSSFRNDIGETSVVIKYNGKNYWGRAILHIEDKDFYSSKVGRHIAISRARINAMKAELKREEYNYKICDKFFYETFSSGRVDPSDKIVYSDELAYALSTKIERMENRCKNLRTAIKREQNSLKLYIEGQEKAITSVKKMRAKDKES